MEAKNVQFKGGFVVVDQATGLLREPRPDDVMPDYSRVVRFPFSAKDVFDFAAKLATMSDEDFLRANGVEPIPPH